VVELGSLNDEESPMSMSFPSQRVQALATAWGPFVRLFQTGLDEGRKAGDACDFSTGDPQEAPLPGYVDTLQRFAVPESRDWFGYTFTVRAAQEAAAASLEEWTGVPFGADGIKLTNGGFGALAASLRAVCDPGDEVIINLPPWPAYEPMAIDAGLSAVKVSIDLATHDLDLDAIEQALSPRTRAVIVNTPHNPTGKIYPPATLERLAGLLDDASERNGRRVFIISDEPYNRIVFDGNRFRTPAEFYPHTFVCYSYGKVLLAPGERIGYVAMPETMPDREAMWLALHAVQASSGYLFPNTILQRALPELEKIGLDVPALQRKRDRMVGALRDIGYELHVPEATFYLMPRSPWPDAWAFFELLMQHKIYTWPGDVIGLPGYFRISLTATEDMIERSLPGFEAAFKQAQAEEPSSP
jgi:aspartate aminotransferase